MFTKRFKSLVYLVPWAQRSTLPMLFFLLRPHQARCLSLAWWWQSLLHGSPISRWEDVDEDDNKEELLVERWDKDLERRRNIVVVTPLHILQWTDQPQLIFALAHCVIIMFCVWRDLSKLFWFFLHLRHVYLDVTLLTAALDHNTNICADSTFRGLLATCLGPI